MKKTRMFYIGTLAMMLLLSTVFCVVAYPFSPIDTEVVDALNYLRNAQKSDGSIENFVTSSWAVMAIAATGEDPHTWRKGGPSIVEYLKANKGLLDPEKATDVARYVLSMSAAGEDPRNITGTDYVAILEGLYVNGQVGGESLLNDDFWGVMALVSAKTANSTIIQDSVNFIKSNQNVDGGWNWAVGGTSDVDDTAAAIMALIAAKESASSTVIANALNYIKSKQMDNGGFESWGATNPGTDSWAIDAIVAAGQDPTSTYWTKNGKTPVDDLLTFQGEDGAFSFPGPSSRKEWATSYAIPALVGKPYPISRAGAVIYLITSKTVIGQGYSMSINVTVANQGNFTETFNVTAYANTTAIQTLTVTNLPPGNSTTITFTWNTTGFAKGVYTISANATTVPGEPDNVDNTYVDGTVRVAMVGDVAPEFGIVDIVDVVYVAILFETEKGDPEYEPNADINDDGIIDIVDIVIVAIHYEETDP